MPLTFNNNIASLSAQRFLTQNTNLLNKSLSRLSSGYRITRVGDDVAGFQIANKLTTQIRGNAAAIQNAEDGLSFLDVAEGAYTGIQEGIQRIRELTVQLANDTYSTDQQNAIKTEIFAKIDELDRIEQTTTYNGKKLFDSSTSGYSIGSSYSFNATTSEGVIYRYGLFRADHGASSYKDKIQIGAGSSATLDSLNIGSAVPALNIKTSLTYDPNDVDNDPFEDNDGSPHTVGQSARGYLQTLDEYAKIIGSQVSTVGSLQNQLGSVIDNLTVTNENYESARSRIQDVDVAKESANLSRYQVLQQASISVLSQANQQYSLTLQLLGL